MLRWCLPDMCSHATCALNSALQAAPTNTPIASARAPSSAACIPPPPRPNSHCSNPARAEHTGQQQQQQQVACADAAEGAAAQECASRAAGHANAPAQGCAPGGTSTTASNTGYVTLSSRDLTFQYPGQPKPQGPRPASASGPGGNGSGGPGSAPQTGLTLPRAATPNSPCAARNPVSLIEKLQPGGGSVEAGAGTAAVAAVPGAAVAPGVGPGSAAAAAAAAPGTSAAGTGAAARGKPIPSIQLHEVTPLDEGPSAWAANLGSAAHAPPFAAGYPRPLSASSTLSGAVAVRRSRSTLNPVRPASFPTAAPATDSMPLQPALASAISSPLYQLPANAEGSMLARSQAAYNPQPSLVLPSASRAGSSFTAHMASITGSGPRSGSLPMQGQPEAALGAREAREQADVFIDGELCYGGAGRNCASACGAAGSMGHLQQGGGVGGGSWDGVRSKQWPPPVPYYPSPHPESHHLMSDPDAAPGVLHGALTGEDMLHGVAMALVQHSASYTPVPPCTPAAGCERPDPRGGPGNITPLFRCNSSTSNTAPNPPLARVYISAPTSLSPSPVPSAGQQHQPSAAAAAAAATGFTVRSVIKTPKAAPKGGSLYTSLRSAPGLATARQAAKAAIAPQAFTPLSMYGVLSGARLSSARQRVLSVTGSSVSGRRSVECDAGQSYVGRRN